MADKKEPESLAPTPFYEALHAARYERQRLIREYQDAFDCRLVVMVDQIFPACITPFEDLICDADPDRDLHFMLWTPGGDGEVAIRLLRMAQSRCKGLVLIVPDAGKSAGTLIALGAHQILMGPASDLGPIDPQMRLTEEEHGLVAAKDVVAAVETAAKAVENAPHTYPIYADLLSNISAIMVEQAKAALKRTDTLLDLALRENKERKEKDLKDVYAVLHRELVEKADYHGQVFGFQEADDAGLPVVLLDPAGEQWKRIWALWTRYYSLPADDHVHVYEGERASSVIIH